MFNDLQAARTTCRVRSARSQACGLRTYVPAAEPDRRIHVQPAVKSRNVAFISASQITMAQFSAASGCRSWTASYL